jgi:hypothetical protein
MALRLFERGFDLDVHRLGFLTLAEDGFLDFVQGRRGGFDLSRQFCHFRPQGLGFRRGFVGQFAAVLNVDLHGRNLPGIHFAVVKLLLLLFGVGAALAWSRWAVRASRAFCSVLAWASSFCPVSRLFA